ncbi:MAG: serpin family protein [Candidatus Eisenbacteria bacterium]|nr:serpin family protein [Candidatus Eisenbacteria bacterium]
MACATASRTSALGVGGAQTASGGGASSETARSETASAETASGGGASSETARSETASGETASAETASGETHGEAVPATPSASGSEMRSVVTGNSAFAIDLYRQLRREPGNLLFSPLSITRALAMTYAGARGRTAREMAEVLHFDLPQERLHATLERWLQDLASAAGSAELRIADRLWPRTGLELLDPFVRLMRERYDAALEPLDFRADPEAARRRINAWIAEQTDQRIPELLQPDDVESDVELVLTDAIYFRGLWQTAFAPEQTRSRPFYSAGAAREVPTMQQTARMRHAQMDGFAVLELPYQESALTMLLLLPDGRDGLPGLEDDLTPALLDECLARLAMRRVNLLLPRLRLRARFHLAETLSAMGMPTAFGPQADLTGMTAPPSLFIDKVIHEAEMEVDEEGTEASAATAVIGKRTSVAEPASDFHADHPFLLLVRDRTGGTLLFVGRVVEP